MAAAAVETFDRSTFQSELSTLCHSLDAPYSGQVTQQILQAFDPYLDDSYVWFRCTSKPGDVVNFRLAFHGKRIDTTAILTKAGWISPDDELARVVRSWSAQEDAEQWCDFDPSRGIAKNWIYFRRLQPIKDILSNHGLPASVAARVPDLQAAGLEHVNFAAVDYANRSINVYFLLDGGLTPERAAKYVGLAGSAPPSEADMQLISENTHPKQTFGVTIIPETGHIPRVAFYAPTKDAQKFPGLKNERMRKFFADHPSRDPNKIHILSWSYGAGEAKTYMKGEASYAGYSEELSRDMFMRWIE